MKSFTTASLLGIFSLTLTFLGMTGEASARYRCHKVSARFVDSITSENCSSPVGLCTSGTITDDDLIEGTVTNVVSSITPVGSNGLLSLTTTQTITTETGTIVSRGTGILDPATGRVSFLEQWPQGTGRYVGVTGALYVNGSPESEITTVGEVYGVLCLP
jgi:hypothetical protein